LFSSKFFLSCCFEHISYVKSVCKPYISCC
jgi:hypothetical protein